MDVESIGSGKFDSIILHQIAARAHFVVILVPGSEMRLAEPGDWLRREIEEAIDLRRNIVRILSSDFSLPPSCGDFNHRQLHGGDSGRQSDWKKRGAFS